MSERGKNTKSAGASEEDGSLLRLRSGPCHKLSIVPKKDGRPRKSIPLSVWRGLRLRPAKSRSKQTTGQPPSNGRVGPNWLWVRFYVDLILANLSCV